MIWSDSGYATSSEESESAFLKVKVKAAINELGTGKKARVEVRLKDGKKLKGYIKESSDEDFILVDSKTNQASTVDYDQIKDVKKIGDTRHLKAILIISGAALTFTWVVLSRTLD